MLNLSVERLLCVLRVTPLPPLLAEVLLLPQHLCFACEETESQRTQLVQIELKIVFYWLHRVFVAACRLSLVAASRGYSSL